MNKAVLRSVKPYWIYLILTGKKTVEVGKDFPKSLDWDKVVYLYCSKDKKSFNRIPEKDREWMRKYLGKVACRFVCDRIDKYECYNELPYDKYNLPKSLLKDMCLICHDVDKYGAGAPLYGWHISDLKIYDEPKELGEFKKTCKHEKYNPPCYPKSCNDCMGNRFERPPQSWCYVEELN